MDYKLFERMAEIKRNKKIEMFEGRPNRDLIINEDDVLNLKIALETAKSFEQFLKMM